jgi:hypothetical protein
MALTPCRECKKEISNQATSCPNCGAKLKPSAFTRVLKVGGIIFAVLVLITAFWSITTPEYEKEAINIRNACYDIVKITADPMLRSTCDQNYESAIRVGAAAASPRAAGIHSTRTDQVIWEKKQKEKDKEYGENCIKNKKLIIYDYQTLSKKNEWWKAGLKVWRCAETTDDKDFKKLASIATEKNK